MILGAFPATAVDYVRSMTSGNKEQTADPAYLNAASSTKRGAKAVSIRKERSDVGAETPRRKPDDEASSNEVADLGAGGLLRGH